MTPLWIASSSTMLGRVSARGNKPNNYLRKCLRKSGATGQSARSRRLTLTTFSKIFIKRRASAARLPSRSLGSRRCGAGRGNAASSLIQSWTRSRSSPKNALRERSLQRCKRSRRFGRPPTICPGHERDYVKLLLLLAPRKSELTGIRPSELKFDDQGQSHCVGDAARTHEIAQEIDERQAEDLYDSAAAALPQHRQRTASQAR